jgi:subtilisin-like proprotein convertase family protein
MSHKLSVSVLWLFCLAVLAPRASASSTFSNTNSIIISDTTNAPTPASPYPSTISVSGLAGSEISKVTVQLFNLHHTFPDDIDILLIGPKGQEAMIMSNVGGETRSPITNINLSLDDDAPSFLPFQPPLVSGTFKPTKRLETLTFDFAAPVPAGSASIPAPLSVFQGTQPNGQWRLFVIDDAYPDSGGIDGGWSLTFTTTPVLLAVEPAANSVVVSWTNSLSGYTLQTTPDLSTAWTNAIPAAVNVGGRYSVTNSTAGLSRFYRLIK